MTQWVNNNSQQNREEKSRTISGIFKYLNPEDASRLKRDLVDYSINIGNTEVLQILSDDFDVDLYGDHVQSAIKTLQHNAWQDSISAPPHDYDINDKCWRDLWKMTDIKTRVV